MTDTIGMSLPAPSKDRQTQVMKDVESFLTANSITEIKNGDDLERAGKILIFIQKKKKLLDEQRFEFTRPLDDLKNKWMAFFRPVQDRLEVARREVDLKMRRYEAEERQRIAEMQRKLHALQLKEAEKAKKQAEKLAERYEKAGDLTGAEFVRQEAEAKGHTALPSLVTENARPAGISRPKTVKWKYENDSQRVKETSSIPEKWWVTVVDEAAVDAFVKANKMTTKIPGIVVYEEEGLRVTGKYSGDDL